MRLSAPKQVTFLIALLLGLLGFVGSLTEVPLISPYAFWFLFVGFLLLVLGVLLKDL